MFVALFPQTPRGPFYGVICSTPHIWLFWVDDMIRMTMEGILLPYPLGRRLSSSTLARSHQKNLLPDIWG